MTREDAILHMILRREELKNSVGDLDEDIKAFDMAIRALEQEYILDKIRAEVERYNSYIDNPIYERLPKPEGMKKAYANCLEIIDKYRAESEEQNE